MLERFSAHCSHKQKEIIQSMEEFEEAQRTGSWKDLRKALKKRFRTNDRPEQSSALWSTYKSSTSEAGAVLKLLQLKKAEGDSIL
ncbi:hypothetical protein PTT_18215 [Pyrenophora teres f. teres 0-1]|uniref:Uncharacterized protein n=1 Tax=Pyrenophora teres f. teres (strain 0-1) TaxID=861557 RepID=E3S686_PYRTT|nr:hypothetical protein PTT_18215 [Pyrenophora teres f. teres 0-1]